MDQFDGKVFARSCAKKCLFCVFLLLLLKVLLLKLSAFKMLLIDHIHKTI